jgi:hypothetical protein
VAVGGDIIFVRLTLSRDEQEKRIGNSDRAAFGKLRSLDLLRELQDQLTASQAAMAPSAFTIVTEATGPTAASRLIADRFNLRRG